MSNFDHEEDEDGLLDSDELEEELRQYSKEQLFEFSVILLENYSLLCTFIVEVGKTEEDFIEWKKQYFKRNLH